MLKLRLTEDMKSAMRAQEKEKLACIRLILAAIKQREIDSRTTGEAIVLDDAGVLEVLEKMVKQRRDSITQFEQGNRQDLADKEKAELLILQAYMPEQLSEADIVDIIRQAITEAGAQTLRDMGKVMAIVKPKVQGRADMAKVGEKIKSQLT